MTLIVIPGHGHEEIPQYFQNQQMLDFMLAELPTSTISSRLIAVPILAKIDNDMSQSHCYNALGQRIMSEEKLSAISHQILLSAETKNERGSGMILNWSNR
jgi:hypothetical protein